MQTKLATFCAFVLTLTQPSVVRADSFGSGANSFNIDFVTIGNPGNANDTTGSPTSAGAVSYSYNIGKYEISRDMLIKANSLGPLALSFGGGTSVNTPVTDVSWNEAARFVNWLNTSTGNVPAYKFAKQPGDPGYWRNDNILVWTPDDPGYDPTNLYRNTLAHYFLPSINEWYKAAYFDPTSNTYFDYPTGSNTAPTSVTSGTTAGTAVYLGPTSFADVTQAGGLSPYGTMAQGGNAWEWEETDFDLHNGSSPAFDERSARGGNHNNPATYLSSSNRGLGIPADNEQLDTVSFRVASSIEVPGDFNRDGTVNMADYVVWRNSNGSVADYNVWRANFGSGLPVAGIGASQSVGVPEPSALAIAILLTAGFAICRRPTSHNRV